MLEHRTEIEVFKTTIQKLTFTYSVPFSTLCEFSYRYKLLGTQLLEPDLYGIPNEELINYSKKHRRLFKRLCVKNHRKDTIEFLIKQPKIYDKFLNESQEKVYKTFSKEDSYRIPQKRNALNFLEFILILNMGIIQQKRGLHTINNPLKDKVSEQRAKKMVDKIINNMTSLDMYEMYVHTFFDILDQVVCKLHNKLAEQCVRNLWLPAQYKNRKDAFTAFNTYNKNKNDPYCQIDYSTPLIEAYLKTFSASDNATKDNSEHKSIDYNKISNTSEIDYKIAEFVDDLEGYTAIEYIGSSILPITFKILLNAYEGNEKEKEYILAKDYANIIDGYIRNSISEVEEILRKLYIDKDSPLRK